MNENNQSKSRMDIYSILLDLLRNAWVIVLAVLSGLMVVGSMNRGMYTPQYTSTATLLVNFKNAAYYSYTNLSSSSEITQIYTSIFRQETMRKLAAARLGQEEFDGVINSSALQSTNIFTVSVVSTDPEVSYKELRAVIEVYPQISDMVFSDCVIEVLREPNLPSSPSNSISKENTVLVAFACGLAAAALIAVISYLRDTAKNETVFKAEVDSKLIGSICHEKRYKTFKSWFRGLFKKEKRAPLVNSSFTSFAFTEDYHRLATRFEYLHRTENATVFLMTSCAENEGKSTVSANVALALAMRKNRVALLDMDFKKPAIYKIFDLIEDENNVGELADFLSGKLSGEQYRFVRHKNPSLDLGINRKSHFDYVDWIHNDRMKEVIDALKNSGRYDFIILDTPPLSVSADNTALSSLSDATVLVVRTDYVPIGEINDVILTLTESSKDFAGCVLNDVHKEFDSLFQFAPDESGQTVSYYGEYGKYGRYDDKSYPGATDRSK